MEHQCEHVSRASMEFSRREFIISGALHVAVMIAYCVPRCVSVPPAVSRPQLTNNITLAEMVKCFYVLMRYTSSAVIILVQTGRTQIRVYCLLPNIFLFHPCIMFLKTISRSWAIYMFRAHSIRKAISENLCVCIYMCMYVYCHVY
jgi:hypothetical protein